MNDKKNTVTELDTPLPIVDILFKPRKTINWILENKSSIIIALILIYFDGVYYGIGHAISTHSGDINSIYDIFRSVLLISGPGGLLIYSIIIWTVSIAASWFGGEGNFKGTLLAYAWTSIPTIISIVLSIIGYLIFDNELFTSATPYIDKSPYLRMIFVLYWILLMIMGVWQVILLVKTLSEVQRFSIIKSILSMLTGALLFIIPLFGILYLIIIL